MSRAVAVQTMAGAAALGRAPQRTERAQAEERPAALPALTGLRFVAALWVVLAHYGAALLPAGAAGPVSGLASAVMAHGYLGVNLFFILSGFILAHTYLQPQGTLRGTARAFYVARVARVYPTYLLCLGLAALPLLLWGSCGLDIPDCRRTAPLAAALWAVPLLQAWVPYSTALDPPAWSLSAEALFYLLFPLLAPALARLLRGRRPCALWGLLVALWGLGLVAPALYGVLNPDRLAQPWAGADGTWLRVVRFMPLLRLPEFCAGIALCLLMRACAARRHSGLGVRHGPALALAGLALACAAGRALPFGLVHDGLFDPLVYALLWGLALAAPGPRGRGPLARALAIRPALALGRASYALYLLQAPLWAIVVRLGGQGPAPTGGAPYTAFLGAYVVLLVASALVVCATVEEPARLLLRRLLARRAVVRAAQEAPST